MVITQLRKRKFFVSQKKAQYFFLCEDCFHALAAEKLPRGAVENVSLNG